MSAFESGESRRLFERACRSLAGGVGGNGRGSAFGFEPCPPYVSWTDGARFADVDGHVYLDYLGGWGPLILGHRPRSVVSAVASTIQEFGSMVGLGHGLEIEAAEAAIQAVPSWQLVRFGNTGSEAVMGAIRMARGFTGRQKILKFEGHFHGWPDLLNYSVKPSLHRAGDESHPLPVPASEGMVEVLADSIVVRPWNNVAALEEAFHTHGDVLAAVICEPIMANAAVIEPEMAFLTRLRELTTANGTVLIFDEVKTGFRVALGGAQQLYGILPDLSVAAKALGAGFPVAAVGGRKDIFEPVLQDRVVYSSTYHTSPLAMAAVAATLKELNVPGFFERLTALGDGLREGLAAAARDAGLKAVVTGVGPILQVVFGTTRLPRNYRELARSADRTTYGRFRKLMLERGIFFNPHPYECWFVSGAHGPSDVEETLQAAAESFRELKEEGA